MLISLATPTGFRRVVCSSTLALLSVCAASSNAQVVVAKPLQTGSANPVTAEPTVPRPSTKPCTVELFHNQVFDDFNARTFSYAPAGCRGPWAKVVFTADITVTAGRQFDHSAAIFLGNATLYRGTTSEPRAALSPSWHVENDVTDLSALFKAAQTVEAHIDGVVDSTYTGVTYANAELEFYPASAQSPAPAVPDQVTGFPQGDPYSFFSTASPLSQAVTLPTNVERAYLDVIAQTDEFWYTCVPTADAGALQSCGGNAFRETDISIDGIPAGVAPARPYIYTGGIDPYLWAPITGLQALNFKPYRIDLTPFAGLLSDGKQHTLGITVANTTSTFFATANLLLYTDHGKGAVTGSVLSNTLTAAATPKVVENLKLDANNYGTATVSVGSNRKFSISGDVYTSHGRVTTTVDQSLEFLNSQQFTINATTYVQNIEQSTMIDSTTTTRTSKGSTVALSHVSFPITVDTSIAYKADGSGVQTVTTNQQDNHEAAGPGYSFALGAEQVQSTDMLSFAPGFVITGKSGTQSSASDFELSSTDGLYFRSLAAKDGLLTSVSGTPAGK